MENDEKIKNVLRETIEANYFEAFTRYLQDRDIKGFLESCFNIENWDLVNVNKIN